MPGDPEANYAPKSIQASYVSNVIAWSNGRVTTWISGSPFATTLSRAHN